jgi:anaerobic selenocysteine-containing dehydrogenase
MNPFIRPARCESAACVEVSTIGDEVTVRSSRDPQRTVVFTAEEWQAFTAPIERAGYEAGWIERDHAMSVSRCISCEHESQMHHSPEGCRFTVTWGEFGSELVRCPCIAKPAADHG